MSIEQGSSLHEVAVEEAENIMESYLDGESYTGHVESRDFGGDELQDEIFSAVNEVEAGDGADYHSRLLQASGAVSGSAGAFMLATGNPLGVGPLAVGGAQYYLGRDHGSSEIRDIERKAFLQDEMYDSLTVEETGDGYVVEFDCDD
ncbi:MAG: hypothetical protein ABEJ36_04750 [Candidatus Nanosalina sp.]